MKQLFDKAVAHLIMALPTRHTSRLLKLPIVSDNAYDIFDRLLDKKLAYYEAKYAAKRLPGH